MNLQILFRLAVQTDYLQNISRVILTLQRRGEAAGAGQYVTSLEAVWRLSLEAFHTIWHLSIEANGTIWHLSIEANGTIWHLSLEANGTILASVLRRRWYHFGICP